MPVAAENDDGRLTPPTLVRFANAFGPVVDPSPGDPVMVKAPPMDWHIGNAPPIEARFPLFRKATYAKGVTDDVWWV